MQFPLIEHCASKGYNYVYARSCVRFVNDSVDIAELCSSVDDTPHCQPNRANITSNPVGKSHSADITDV